MKPKRFFWLLLKKLPIILTILVTPATMAYVVYVNPSILDFNRNSSEKDSRPERRQVLPDRPGGTGAVDPGIDMPAGREGAPAAEDEPAFEPSPPLPPPDWAAEVALCSTSSDYVNLARRAGLHNAKELAREFFLEALRLDPKNREARLGLGEVQFDPEKSLDRFDRFVGHQLEGDLLPFRKKMGQWLSPTDLAALREEWERTRTRLEAELERRINDPHEEERRRHMRRLMRHDFFAQLINNGRFQTDRSHLPCLFFLESGDSVDMDAATALKEIVAADLDHVLETFQRSYLDGSESKVADQVFFVWLVHGKDQLSVRYEQADRMLLIRLPGGKKPPPVDEIFRRRTVSSFTQMIVRQLRSAAKEESDMWLSAGIPLLMAWGRGTDDSGRLLMGGAGSDENDLFTRWLAMNDGAWPVPLDRLVAYADLDEFREDCSSTIPYSNPRLGKVKALEIFYGAGAACAAFCRFLVEEVDREAFRQYAGRWLRGEKNGGGAASLLGPMSLASAERDVSEAFISLDAAVVYRPPTNRGRQEPLSWKEPTEGKKQVPLVAEDDPCLSPDEIAALVRPGLSAEVLRPLIIRHVDAGSCFEAFTRLTRSFDDQGISLPGSGLEDDLDLLARGARFESEMFSRLALANASFRLDGKELQIRKAAEGKLVCSSGKVDAADVELPWSRLEFVRFLSLCKNELKAKSEKERLGYGLLHLLRANKAGLRKELRYVSSSDEEKTELNEAARRFARSVPGVTLIAILAGEREDEEDRALKALVQKMSGSPLIEALKPFIERLITNHVMKKLLDPETGYLASTFPGFKGTEQDTAISRFEYRFEDAGELSDFCLLPSPGCADFPGSGTPLQGSRPPRVEDGVLIGSGTGGAMLRPRFSGSIELFLKFRLRWKDRDPDAPWGFLAGFGLESERGIVVAEDFETVSIRRTPTGLPLAERRFEEPPAIKWDRSYTLFLKGTGRKVFFRFDGKKTVALPVKGAWNGHLFFWVNSSIIYQIERLEVRGAIDPEWLKKQVGPSLEKELRAALPDL